jgi:uridine phosphorylase
VRAEGLTPKLVPLGYPALAHHQVVAALARAAAQANARTRAGVVLTEDLFYPATAVGYDWQVWQRSGVVAVEMELAALFIIAAMHGIRTGGILTVDGNPTQAAEDMSDYDPHRRVVVEGKARMLEIALAVLQGID